MVATVDERVAPAAKTYNEGRADSLGRKLVYQQHHRARSSAIKHAGAPGASSRLRTPLAEEIAKLYADAYRLAPFYRKQLRGKVTYETRKVGFRWKQKA